jgi:hypothetical protein
MNIPISAERLAKNATHGSKYENKRRANKKAQLKLGFE